MLRRSYLARQKGIVLIWARRTILATGGCGQVYRETTNPDVATGDGLAMAYRAGAAFQDMEFVQFHPTTLYIAGAVRFLITETVRGEGGILRNKIGERFMPNYHPQAELAPRDVVSQSILQEMQKTDHTNVYVDVRHIPKKTPVRPLPQDQRDLCLFWNRYCQRPDSRAPQRSLYDRRHQGRPFFQNYHQTTLCLRRSGLHGNAWRQPAWQQFPARGAGNGLYGRYGCL